MKGSECRTILKPIRYKLYSRENEEITYNTLKLLMLTTFFNRLHEMSWLATFCESSRESAQQKSPAARMQQNAHPYPVSRNE